MWNAETICYKFGRWIRWDLEPYKKGARDQLRGVQQIQGTRRAFAAFFHACRFSCVDIVFEAILHIHAVPGDLFVFRMIASQCRLMCVDTVYEAIFKCDAMQVLF